MEPFRALLQWLRKRACESVASEIVPFSPLGSHFYEHLEQVIWSFLRYAVLVPRDGSFEEALKVAGGQTLLLSGSFHKLLVDRGAVLCALGQAELSKLLLKTLGQLAGTTNLLILVYIMIYYDMI